MNKVKKNLDLAGGIISIVLAAIVVVASVIAVITLLIPMLSAGYFSIIPVIAILASIGLSIAILVLGVKTVKAPGATSMANNIGTIIVSAVLLVLNIIGWVPAFVSFISILYYPMLVCIIGFKVANVVIK